MIIDRRRALSHWVALGRSPPCVVAGSSSGESEVKARVIALLALVIAVPAAIGLYPAIRYGAMRVSRGGAHVQPAWVVRVDTTYPGANAPVVADTIAAPIEQQITGLEGMKRIRSRCRNDGSYSLIIELDDSVNFDQLENRIQNRVNLALPMMPEIVKRNGITLKQMSALPLAFVTITSPDSSRDSYYLGTY